MIRTGESPLRQPARLCWWGVAATVVADWATARCQAAAVAAVAETRHRHVLIFLGSLPLPVMRFLV
jgi:hypothetical protein